MSSEEPESQEADIYTSGVGHLKKPNMVITVANLQAAVRLIRFSKFRTLPIPNGTVLVPEKFYGKSQHTVTKLSQAQSSPENFICT